MRPAALRRSLVVAALCACGSAMAAPTAASSDDNANSPGASTSADGQPANNGDTSAPSSGNRTIDRLLNGPGPDAEHSASDRPVKKLVEGSLPTKLAAGVTAASAPNPLAELQSVILGNRESKSDKAPAEQNAEFPQTRRAGADQVSNGSRAAQHDTVAGVASAESSGVAVKVARYIRENRMLVIGASLLVLALVWGAASFASQRRG